MAENKYGVELISGLTPKNGGDFPLIHAKDVEMSDGTRLSEFKGGEGITGLPDVTADDNGKILRVVGGTWSASEDAESGEALPTVSTDDNGKILKVENGAWTAAEADDPMPAVTADDNGKVMQVVDGAWQAVTLENSEIKTYIDTYISEALGGDY